MLTFVLTILAVGLLVVVHEGGHFIVARLCGMHAYEFSVGFGPQIAAFRWKGTEFRIGAVPLGGYVRIAGLNPYDEDLPPTDPRSFPNRPVFQRMAVIIAGPGMNYVFAFLMSILVFTRYGVPIPGQTPMVGGLIEGAPAEAAGLQPGDELVSIGGKKVTTIEEVAPTVEATAGQTFVIEVLRDSKPMSFSVNAKRDGDHWRVGIEVIEKEIWTPSPARTVLLEAVKFPFEYSVFILHGLWDVMRGHQKAELSGPVGIIKVMHKEIKSGLKRGLQVVTIISIYIGLFNMLPLPALDGGRIMFLLWEMISRRRVSQTIEATVHMVGMLALVSLALIVTFGSDIPKLFRHH